jgi:hypothetical protein
MSEEHEFETIAEAIGHYYTGKVVQLYFGESGGTTNYADYDIEQKIFIEGLVLWAKGMVIMLEVNVVTPSRSIKKEILVNGWSITAVMPKGSDTIQISHIIQGTKR